MQTIDIIFIALVYFLSFILLLALILAILTFLFYACKNLQDKRAAIKADRELENNLRKTLKALHNTDQAKLYARSKRP